jgi:hypothetical protein
VITVFTTPKPFFGHFATIQRNALASWSRLHQNVQILVFGDEAGSAEVAGEFGAEHVPGVELSSAGTPLLSDMFRRAASMAVNDLLCYANADIVLFSDLVFAAETIDFPDFLMIGRRTNIDQLDPVDFSEPERATTFRKRVEIEGDLFTPFGIDYFVLPRTGSVIPLDFPVGRAMWDNWMIYAARKRGVPVIDATDAVLAVHQNHDYSHIEGGKTAAFLGTEVQQNWELVGEGFYRFSIDEADWKLDQNYRLMRRGILRRPARRTFSNVALLPGGPALIGSARRLKHVFKPVSSSKPY